MWKSTALVKFDTREIILLYIWLEIHDKAFSCPLEVQVNEVLLYTQSRYLFPKIYENMMAWL